VAEQTLPSIAGYFAGMLYNPNNVSGEAAPVTILIELEVGRMIAEIPGYDQKFFVSRTTLSRAQYRTETVLPFLHRMGVSASDFEDRGIFLLRSTLMNPWYSAAKTSRSALPRHLGRGTV